MRPAWWVGKRQSADGWSLRGCRVDWRDGCSIRGVDLPVTPVERFKALRPRFCPWRDCPQHLRREAGYRFQRFGSYRRRGVDVPRFRCVTCGRTFSRQAFSTTYYLKRPELLRPVAAGLVAGAAHRQLARTLGCAPSTVTRLAARLGRHGLLLHAHALRWLARNGGVVEPIVFDHFETFELTQDYPSAWPRRWGASRGWSMPSIPRRIAAPGGRHPTSGSVLRGVRERRRTVGTAARSGGCWIGSSGSAASRSSS